MARKSDKVRRRPARLSATEASRSFSELLDQVAAGERFVVHRRGLDVCQIAPAEVAGRRLSACLELVRGRGTPPGEGWGSDLRDIVRGEPVDRRPTWDS